MTGAALSDRQRALGLSAVVLSSGCAGLALGMLFPLASLTLERWGVSGTLIGLNGAMQSLAMLAVGPFLAGFVRRVGPAAALIVGSLAGALAILGLAAIPWLPGWFLLRFVIGCGLALPWLLAETWINAIARDGSRGRVIGIYSMALFAGMALGPVLLRWLGSAGWTPFAGAAGAILLAALPLLLARDLIPTLESPQGMGVLHAVRRTPTVAGAALLAGLSESACYTLLPVYGVRVGVGEQAALGWLTVLILGAIALQTPIGWIADRVDRRRLLRWAALAGAALPLVLLLAVLQAAWLVWLPLVLLGGVALGYYTVGLALLGQRYAPGELAVANAAFMMLYETGTTAGPALAGAAMELWAPHGYPIALAAFAGGFAVLTAIRRAPAPR